MRKVLDEDSIERADQLGNRWIGKWIAWEDEIERKVEVNYQGHADSMTITGAQAFREAYIQVAGDLFERILRNLGHLRVAK